MFRRTKTYIFSLLALSTMACNDTYVSSIPNYPVSLQLSLTSTYPTFKNSSNEYLLIELENRRFDTDRIGFGGILVYTGISLDDSGNTQYYAFDMACPYEADKTIKVHPIEGSLGKVQCETCGSIFDISFGFGAPTEGPAKEALKKYRTSLSSNGDVLYINR